MAIFVVAFLLCTITVFILVFLGNLFRDFRDGYRYVKRRQIGAGIAVMLRRIRPVFLCENIYN